MPGALVLPETNALEDHRDMPTTESSVLTNLRELERLEAERITTEKAAQDAAERARHRADVDAKAAAEAAEVHARRVAEAEAEARLAREADRADKDAEASRRMATLRAELAAVQADRERMHARIATLADDGWAADGARERSWGWKVAFASAGAVAAGLALILAIREPVPQTRIVEVPVERTVIVDTRPASSDDDESAIAEGSSDTPSIVAEPTADVRPARVRPGMRPRMVTMEVDLLGNLDCPEDDPTCGI